MRIESIQTGRLAFAFFSISKHCPFRTHRHDGARTQIQYDAQGRITEIRTFSNGTVVYTASYKYNDHGDISRQIVTSDPLLPPRNHQTETWTMAYTYTYDAHGNWTKCVESAVSKKNGKDVLTPKKATYRALVYAAPAEK